jgi:serine/threonine protein kinase
VSSDDCPHALTPGTRIRDYTILSVIGTCGFSIVYKAMDNALRRVVAIKEYFPPSFALRDADGMVRPHSRDAETFRTGITSFLNEGKLLAQFDHPALVRVYRCWEESGTAYLAMKLYDGATLRDAVRSGNFVLNQATMQALMRPLFDTLELLHESQCYHRDVAPDNILISDIHTPVLLDFGAARKAIEGTQVFTAILKPGYAPIEQYGDGEMQQGPWTDIYALAGVIIFALTGQPPPTAISRIMKDAMPRPRDAFAGRLPETWLDAIERALAVKPENRPQSIKELREMLGWSGDPFASIINLSGEGGITYTPGNAVDEPSNPTVSQPALSARTQVNSAFGGASDMSSPAMLAPGYAVTSRFDPNADAGTGAGGDTSVSAPAAAAAAAELPRSIRPAAPPPAVVESRPVPVPPAAPVLPAAISEKTPPRLTKASAAPTEVSTRSGSRAGIWIASLAGVVAVGALAFFLQSGTKTRLPEPQTQTKPLPSVTAPAPTVATPPPIAPSPAPPVEAPPAPSVAPAETPTATGAPVSPGGDAILDLPKVANPDQKPKVLSSTATLPSSAAARDDRPTKSTNKPTAQKNEGTADDDDYQDVPDSGFRKSSRPARCVGLLQDFGLGTTLSDEDQQFVRNKCK